MDRQALHRTEDALVAGADPAHAKAAAILIHGRGATPESLLPLTGAFQRDDIRYVLPRARGNTWYPNSFLAPLEANEPWLSSALTLIGTLVEGMRADGFPAEKIVIGGFSQGACLTSEFVARNARRYGAILVLTGGLIGPTGTPREYQGSLSGTPAFLGSSDVDPHVPLERFKETAAVMTQLGAKVDARVYPGMGHTVNEDEVRAVRKLLEGMAK